MSMENAILDHAGALKELAAAIRESVKLMAHAQIGTALANCAGALVEVETRTGAEKVAASIEKKTAEDAERKKRAEDAAEIKAIREGEKPNPYAETKAADAADAELEASVREVEKQNAPAELDYAKDVRPALLIAIKGGKRAEIEAHLAKAGVAKADQLKPEQLPAILELAQKLAADIDAAKAA